MSNTPNEQCAALPSSNTAARIWDGDPAAFPTILRDLALRGLLISTGMYLAGARGKPLIVQALAGSAVIEGFVLAWIGYDRWHAKQQGQLSATPTPVQSAQQYMTLA